MGKFLWSPNHKIKKGSINQHGNQHGVDQLDKLNSRKLVFLALFKNKNFFPKIQPKANKIYNKEHFRYVKSPWAKFLLSALF